MPPPTDFSSAEYWSTRFENESSFEWLISDEKLIPFIEENLDLVYPYHVQHDADDGGIPRDGVPQEDTDGDTEKEKKLNILHFGSGTSSLGPSLQRHLVQRNINVKVYDSDYVPTPSSSRSIDDQEGEVSFLLMDVLDLHSLKSSFPSRSNDGGKWDYLIDKSTCDAISCSPALPNNGHKTQIRGTQDPSGDIDVGGMGELDEMESEEIQDPVERLLFNLSKVIKKGGRWLSISYSSNRFQQHDHTQKPTPLANSKKFTDPGQNGRQGQGDDQDSYLSKFGWKLIKKQMISTTYIPGGKIVKDSKTGMERVVYEPETGVWLYVLERI